ncbi:MAG: alpha/beta hydrolase [Planctomycetota bacterium]|nr:MAG: alpha/beta hydrolase [Planctomycetota bacterium]
MAMKIIVASLAVPRASFLHRQAAGRLPIWGAWLASVALFSSAAIADEPAVSAQAPPEKHLILPGEVFAVAGHTAFLFTPATSDAVPAGALRPWILYAPTLPAYPDEAERWMHDRFTEAGVAVAGIDTGESYGSPEAVRATELLHAEMVKRGYSARPAVLGRSRGGLWAAAWAIAHPEWTAGLGGIYPVYDWRTYPGAAGAAAAYGLEPAELSARAAELCPIERIGVAAQADVPVCIIHGDEDQVVPLEPNSATLKRRYEAAGKGDRVQLLIAKGQGHNFWEGFFHCRELVDFLIERARKGSEGRPAAGN